MSNITTQGGVTLSVNSEEFVKALRQYVAVRLKEPLAEIVNRKMLYILSGARKLTPLGDRGKILSDLGATSTQKTSKSGKVRSSNKYNQNSSAVNIVQWRRKMRGLPPLTQAEAKKEAAKMTGKRLKAVGSLKSGWVKAIRTLSRAVKEAVESSGPNVKQAGSATIAKDGWSPEAIAEYTLTVGTGESRKIDPRVEAAVQESMAKETASTLAYIEQKLKKSLPELRS
jgi:hypothetical protein